MTRLESALKLAALGFFVFPLKPNSKEPKFNGWQDSATRDPQTIEAIWTVNPNFNIGINTGKFGTGGALCVVDVDNKPEIDKDGLKVFMQMEIAGYDFPPTSEQKTPSGGFHLIYHCPEPVTGGVNSIGAEFGKGIDIRSAGNLIVGAESVFEGKAYEWVDRPLQEAPGWLLEECGKAKLREAKAHEVLRGIDPDRAAKRALQYLVDDCLLATRGERNQMGYMAACRLKDFGVDQKTCLDLMVNHWPCEPMLERDEIAHIVQSAYSYGREPVGAAAPETQFDELDPGPPKKKTPFEKLNDEFAFVIAGGDSHILWETTDAKGQYTLIHLGETAFHKKFASKTIEVGEHKKPLTRMWMNSGVRRSYDGICFSPKQEAPKRFYNLWRGFTVGLPKDPRSLPSNAHRALERFQDLLLYSACNGDKAQAHWLTGYFAHLIQRPYEKPMVAPVFKGSKGVGKDSLINMVGGLLGVHYLMTAKKRYLVGNFNGHLENLLLFCLNEAFWSGDPQAEGILKDLITGNTHLIEHKGKAPYSIENLTRVVIMGNEDWLVPASEDERRYAVFDFTDKRKNQISWFKEMHKGMTEGGNQLLLQYLDTYDISNVDVNDAPKTSGLLAQKLNTLDPFYVWWMECLREERIVDSDFSEGWSTILNTKQFMNAFLRNRKSRGVFGPSPADNQIGKLFKRCLPSHEAFRKREGGTQVYYYSIPSLEVCRLEFERFLGAPIDW